MSKAPLALEVAPADVKRRLDAGEPLRLIDVREPFERQIASIEPSRLIPMNTVPQHLAELDDDGSGYIVFCHHGVRSLSVANWLRQQGIENCQSMSGGIDQWSLQIDPSVPRY